MSVCRIVAVVCGLIAGPPLQAFAEFPPPTSDLRTHYGEAEGLSNPVVNNISQTRDGFLWLVTSGVELVRFDGKTFHYFDTPEVASLAVAPDGALWVGGWRGELIRIPPSSFSRYRLTERTSYQLGRSIRIYTLRFARSGVLWIGTTQGAFRFERGAFVAVGPPVEIRQIEEASDGRMLITTVNGLVEIDGSQVRHRHDLARQLGLAGTEIFHVFEDRRRNVWYATSAGLARETNGRIEKLGAYGRNGKSALRVHEDARGTIWIAMAHGLVRATATGLELVSAGMRVLSFFSDRDGQLWVGTNGDTLYRFKEAAARMFTTADGLPSPVVMSVIVRRDGTVWTGANCGGISRFDGRRFETFGVRHGLRNDCVFSLAEDAQGDLWIGTFGGGAFRYRNGVYTQYSIPQGMAHDAVTNIVTGRDGSVWFGTNRGLSRLKGGRFRTFTTADGLSANAVNRLYEDLEGVLWAGSRAGLNRLVGDRFEIVDYAPKGFAIPIGEDRDGGFFTSVQVEGGYLTRRTTRAGEQHVRDMSVYNMVESAQGELWFDSGLISRMLPGRFSRSQARDEPLDYETFSTSDGLATNEVSGLVQNNIALTDDGKVWVATTKGVAVLDSRRLVVTDTKPSIYLTSITVGRNKGPADSEIVLPPGTHHIQIAFAAIELSSPEKIRLQYRLDDVDSEWLDAGSGREAIYSALPPGRHALRIRACNRHGIWDRQGAVFSITQLPFFYQTHWAHATGAGVAVLMIVGLYRLRVRQIARVMSARFDERLAERSRVARELHDTLLQTVHGSKLVADRALRDTADRDRLVRALEQLSVWLGQAAAEGRAALQSLRASTTEGNDLADAFRRAIDECRNDSSTETRFYGQGRARELHPVMRDEVYRIGYEAIRNACAHARASRVDVVLEYGHDLTLRIGDNGVGIDAEVIETGKEGHFGLRGMRERAERIGATFTLVSGPGTGTAITLIVPGRIAFRSA